MKTIGFADFYLSEWHANNYPAWIKAACEKTGLDYCVKYAWAEKEVSPVDGRSTEEWCRNFGTERCETLDELCQKSDFILILAPSDPETHLKYAKTVLKYKKNTYIDKTFAPDFETAKAIFELSDRYGTKFFSTSALRYADELKDLEHCRAIITTGGGSNYDEYIIHQIEIAVKTVGEKPKAVRTETQGDQILSSIRFKNGAKAQLLFAPSYPFTLNAEDQNGESVYRTVESDFFKTLTEDILNFFENGTVPFPPSETLDVMQIRSALIESKTHSGEWNDL